MYLPPLAATPSDDGGTVGHSYGAVILSGDEATRSEALTVLRGIGFSGWVAPARDGCVVVVGDHGGGVVANRRRGIIDVACQLAERVPGAVIAARVLRDQQLGLVAWNAGQEVARYCSDPAVEPGADEDVLSDPIGAEQGEIVAALCGRADAAEDLVELLDEQLDRDSTSESERLGQVLRMLGLPSWLVAAGELPKEMPTGPRTRELTRLRVGRRGVAGILQGFFVRRSRRRKNPPPIIVDPPKGHSMGYESWMY